VFQSKFSKQQMLWISQFFRKSEATVSSCAAEVGFDPMATKIGLLTKPGRYRGGSRRSTICIAEADRLFLWPSTAERTVTRPLDELGV
jgi:hypothetical protein